MRIWVLFISLITILNCPPCNLLVEFDTTLIFVALKINLKKQTSLNLQTFFSNTQILKNYDFKQKEKDNIKPHKRSSIKFVGEATSTLK